MNFSDMTLKIQQQKREKDKMELQHTYTSKHTINKVKRESAKW